MAKNFVQVGNIVELTAPAGGVVSGQAYRIGSIVVIATVSAAAGEKFNGQRTGVFTLTKVSANAPTEGAKAYLQNTATDGVFLVSTASTSATLIGAFTEAAANGDDEANVLLTGQVV